ncbi:MAG: hypothetical protein H6713_32840 [Myxococcales bacterium]|nr:hypothetical protein [Myxococcales bacterium]MCB9754748.1 hypothetical protein [Myxococcales bacterium]
MSAFRKLSAAIVISALALLIAPTCSLVTIPMGSVGVRASNISGVDEHDLGPGWHLNIAGIHRVTMLPSHYLFLDYTQDGDQSLLIRTQDNNNVTVDITVPYRIIPGEAFDIMKEGNHVSTGDGFRFERLAANTTVSVLREEIAELTSADFYNTERRLEVAAATLKVLNEQLKPLHLEAQAVLIRSVQFRDEYEVQLQNIQLNEQNKLLDGAREKVAKEQQKLDNFTLETNALVAARQQEWAKKVADLDRAYQVGFIEDPEGDRSPGRARRLMQAMTTEQRAEHVKTAAEVLEIEDSDKITDAYLLGIKNIEAETLEYKQRVTAEADGISARLVAEGEADIAAVRGEFESKLNALLDSPGGRAYVAYRAASNVKFDDVLTFQSDDGIPSVLRLRDFAERFMGSK